MNEALNDYLWEYHTGKAVVPYMEKLLSLVDGDSTRLITTLHGDSGILLNSEGHIITSEALKTKITKRYQRNLTSTDAEIMKAADTIARMLA